MADTNELTTAVLRALNTVRVDDPAGYNQIVDRPRVSSFPPPPLLPFPAIATSIFSAITSTEKWPLLFRATPPAQPSSG